MAYGDSMVERTTVGQGGDRALKVLAKSVFRELKRSGYNRAEMVAFASELLDLVTTDFKSDADTQA